MKKIPAIFLGLLSLIVVSGVSARRTGGTLTDPAHIFSSSSKPSHARSSAKASSSIRMNSGTCVFTNGVPDVNCTPGFRDPNVTDQNIDSTICVSGYSKTVRPPASVTSKIKQQVAVLYNQDPSPKNMSFYEGDHALSIEDGGCPGPVQCGENFQKNFVDEPYCTSGAACTASDPRASADPLGAKQKDSVENEVHKELCARKINLDRAAWYLPLHWTECLKLLHLKKPCL